MDEHEIQQQRIILFDGICNLCNGSVIFILKHERDSILRFASIQSDIGRELLHWCGMPVDFDWAIVYLENGTIHLGSTAALKIGQNLRQPWAFIAHAGLLVPKSIRDWVYNRISQNRYLWFGKRDVCMVPSDALKQRFL